MSLPRPAAGVMFFQSGFPKESVVIQDVHRSQIRSNVLVRLVRPCAGFFMELLELLLRK